nr:uncharacterized protein LOC111420896 isoform X1 [Onthophagus taurus]
MVQINYIRVPHALKNNSGKSAILDCNYSVRPDDTELVVKWFLNNELVYQWVPPQKPQSLGVLKNRVDLSYRASADPKAVFRALKISNPTTEIAGVYKCFVSTFADEDFSVKTMIIFVPEKSLHLHRSPNINGKVNFTCLAEEVYPQAHLILFMDKMTNNGMNNLEPVEWSTKKHADGKFSLQQTSTIQVNKLEFGSLVFCEMRIPGTGYIKRQTLLYYPESSRSYCRKIMLQPLIFYLITLLIQFIL